MKINHTYHFSEILLTFCKEKLHQASSFNIFHFKYKIQKTQFYTIIIILLTIVRGVYNKTLRCVFSFQPGDTHYYCGLKGKQRYSRPFLYCSFPRGFRIRNMTSDTFMEQSMTKYECEKNISQHQRKVQMKKKRGKMCPATEM